MSQNDRRVAEKFIEDDGALRQQILDSSHGLGVVLDTTAWRETS